ncbi:MAG: glycosyltransferase family A protein [Acidimicrobiia bacterium]|nr:glycosyltransferase family A protein [Acidimicrobiia bacterium]
MADQPPLLSIVICTFNRAERLGDLVGQLLADQDCNYEILVVDDGSTDDTKAVVAAFDDPRVRYEYQVNGGLSVARNTGLRQARGELVAFVDDDDRPVATWAAQLSAPFADDPDCAVVMCGVIDVKGDVEVTRLPLRLGPVFDDFEGLIAAGSFAVRRAAALEAGGFDDNIRCSHQTEFMLRMLPLCTARSWRVVAIPDALLRINWAAPDARGRNNPERLLDCTERLVDVHGDRLRRDPHAYANYAAVCGACCARLGRYGDARGWFARAWRSERSMRHLSRTAITLVPPVARRVWGVS